MVRCLLALSVFRSGVLCLFATWLDVVLLMVRFSGRQFWCFFHFKLARFFWVLLIPAIFFSASGVLYLFASWLDVVFCGCGFLVDCSDVSLILNLRRPFGQASAFFSIFPDYA